MKCPLLCLGRLATKTSTHDTFLNNCLKELCSWWEKGDGRCGFLDVVYQLDGIREALFDIAAALKRN